MATLHINMTQFRKKWRDYTDNIRVGNSIRNTNGMVLTLDPRHYIEWLSEFSIFYTLSK